MRKLLFQFMLSFSVIIFSRYIFCDDSSGEYSILNLNPIKQNKAYLYEITITNTFDGNLGITRVSSSCECVTVKSYTKTIPAKAEGRVITRILSHEAGSFAYEVEVRTDNPTGKSYKFLLMVTVEKNA